MSPHPPHTPSGAKPAEKRITWGALVDLIVVIGAMGAVGAVLPWGLILSPSAPTGGDTPSHFAALNYFVGQILPQGRLWGWHPGNLAGYPAFQFYFPLPFALMALLGQFTGLAEAFKIITVLPALGMPACVYAGLRLMRAPRPAPAFGAAASLLFILSEQNTVWGGNLASLLAGEICYAWAFDLTPLYLGVLPGWLKGRRGPLGPVILLTLIGLSHAYGLLFCLLAGLYFLFFLRPWRAMAARLFMAYALAFLLLAVWTIPMLAYSPYTEMFNFVWINESWLDYLPPNLMPLAVLAAIGAGLAWRGAGAGSRMLTGYLLFWIAVAAGLFLAAPFMNTITIRFAPFAHLALVLLGACGLEAVTRRLTGRWLLAVIALISCFAFAGLRLDFTPAWLDWNNSGIEAKPLWPPLQKLCAHLRPAGKGFDPGSPRVAYEHSALSEPAGSIRVFESLPYLAGRSTLEGLYLQASPNAPFIFYIQSEISRRGSTPLPGYVYAGRNLKRGLEHMRLFNVGHYIVVEPGTRELADGLSGLILEREFGPFSVYRIKNQQGYLAPARYLPVLVKTNRPQYLAYQWFRFTDLKTPLAFVSPGEPTPKAPFSKVHTDSGRENDSLLKAVGNNALPRKKPETEPKQPEVTLGYESMKAKGLSPGQPYIFKMSYHPAWRSLGGEAIYRVSPAFMLIYPKSTRLELAFGKTWVHRAGEALTILGVLLCGLAALRPPWWQRGWIMARQAQGPAAPGRLKAPVMLAAAAALAALLFWHDDANTMRAKAHKLLAEKKDGKAARLLEEVMRRFPFSLVSDYTLYDLAMIHHRHGRGEQSTALFERLRRQYPDSIVLPETLYHLGLDMMAAGQHQRAREIKKELMERFPDNRWSKEAAQWP